MSLCKEKPKQEMPTRKQLMRSTKTHLGMLLGHSIPKKDLVDLVLSLVYKQQ